MAFKVVYPSGRRLFVDDYATQKAAKQALVNLIYGAKLGDSKKGNDDALKYIEAKIVPVK